MDYSRIPDKLKSLDQWVCCWDNSKVPMKAYERKAASSVSSDTWSSFEQAEWAVNEGHYDHVGFVFADNGIVGIDIDCGFDDGLMTPLCADIMSACHSYTEKSRSGRGVHILLYGDLPFSGKNNLKGVEIYKSRRFFIMTGKDLIFNDMIENQAAIDYVLAKYFSDLPKKTNDKPLVTERIYNPVFPKPADGKIALRPDYPAIREGGRNLSLTSLAGSMHLTGYNKKQIYQELCYVNDTCCCPPLDIREVQAVVESVTKYQR